MKTQHTVNNNGVNEKRVKLIEEFYNSVETDMSYKDFEAVCKTPFVHMRKAIASEHLYDIRFKYLGKFIPIPSNIVGLLEYVQNRYDNKLISQSIYNEDIINLIQYISSNPDKFMKYKTKLKRWIKI